MPETDLPSERTTICLANWRQNPHSRFAFHHVREFIGTATVKGAARPSPLATHPARLEDLEREILQPNLGTWLTQNDTDAFIVLKAGQIALEWYAPHYVDPEPHILFSISKSVTGLLAGILQHAGILEPTAEVIEYLPEAKDCGYGKCTIQHLLDMQAAIAFDENYLDQTGQFAQYRAATGWNPAQPGIDAPAGLAEFLLTLKASPRTHGEVFRYLSPNSDLLGLILERATGKRYADLLSQYLWQPLGCETDAYITVDSAGAARSAGGLCVHPRDLARLGRAISLAASGRENPTIPIPWIKDTLDNGSFSAWRQGDFADFLPQGVYRNQWYLTGGAAGAIMAIGIHGQWLYVDPTRDVVIVKLSSQHKPLDEALDVRLVDHFTRIASTL